MDKLVGAIEIFLAVVGFLFLMAIAIDKIVDKFNK